MVIGGDYAAHNLSRCKGDGIQGKAVHISKYMFRPNRAQHLFNATPIANTLHNPRFSNVTYVTYFHTAILYHPLRIVDERI